MATFLTLPRELRDQILELAILSPFKYNYDATRKPVTMGCFDIELPSNSIPTWSNLLLTNYQLHAETQDLVRIRKPYYYVLDLAVVYTNSDEQSWPTWRYIPPRQPPIIESFDLTILPCYTGAQGGIFSEPSVRDAKVQRALIRLNDYLLTFLRLRKPGDIVRPSRGAYILSLRTKGPRRNGVIKTLRLNINMKDLKEKEIVSLEEVPGRTIKWHPIGPVTLHRYDDTSIENFFSSLIATLKGFLQTENYIHIPVIFFTQIGEIIFSVDGKERARSGTAATLMPADTDSKRLKENKERIRKNRMDFGLSP
jgi:hypothetical protein